MEIREMIAFRDARVKELGLELIVHVNRDGLERGIDPIASGSSLHTDVMKTQALRQALDHHRFDAALGGARRDEEKSRAKERVFSLRNAQHVWDPKRQRPEPWRIYNGRKRPGESIRVFPLSNWTELDVWLYIHRERIAVVPLYFAAPRPVVERDGALIMVDDDRLPLKSGERPQIRLVRFRTLGCYPLTGAIESTARSFPKSSRRRWRAGIPNGAAASSTTTARRRWSGKSRKDISDERACAAGGTGICCAVARAGAQKPIALHRLRLGRSRQVDADRPAALQLQASL